MGGVGWKRVLVFALVVMMVFALGLGVLFLAFGGGTGMMGPGMMGPGGTRWGWCPWCGGAGRFGGGLLGAFLAVSIACLLPLILMALLAVGGVWLLRTGRDGGAERPPRACPSCGRPVEPGWRACPYCGEDLGGE